MNNLLVKEKALKKIEMIKNGADSRRHLCCTSEEIFV